MYACMCAKLLQSCPTLCDPTNCSLPGFSLHGVLQTSILEWVTMPSSRDLPNPRIEPTSLMSPALTGRFFTTSTIQGHVITPYLVSSEYFLSLTWYTTFWSMSMSEVYFLCKTRTSLRVGNGSYAVQDPAKSKSTMLSKCGIHHPILLVSFLPRRGLVCILIQLILVAKL